MCLLIFKETKLSAGTLVLSFTNTHHLVLQTSSKPPAAPVLRYYVMADRCRKEHGDARRKGKASFALQRTSEAADCQEPEHATCGAWMSRDGPRTRDSLIGNV